MSDAEDLNDTFSKENNMAIAMRNIFESCDEDGRGRVAVSKLMDYIKPYMAANVSEINALQMCLDPEDTDPEITSDIFYNVMSDWAKKFDQEESFHNISPSHLENPPLVESTPRKSFGGRQARIYAEAVALDMSIVEATSFVGNDCNESVMEKSVLEDQIKQLTHQSRKFNDELLLARSQLIGQEEHNLILQNEIEKLNKDLKNERDINETLQKEHKKCEELRENSFNKQKYIDQLKKDLLHCEREKAQLEEHNTSLDNEKQRIEEKMQRIHEKLSQSRRETIELRAEMNMKDEQLSFANDVKKDLLQKITDLKDTIANLEEANSCLRVEKEKISKLLQDNIKLQSQAVLNYPAPKQSEYTKDTTPTADTHDTHTVHTPHTTRPQHANITQYFTPQSAQEAHSTSQLSDEEDTLDSKTPDVLETRANNVQGQLECKGDLGEVGTRFNRDGTSIPFVSPIKTSKFTFFNIDSPIAKRCQQYAKALQLHDNDPHTPPTDLVSPPGMYVIERTVERKPAQFEIANVSVDESGNEDELLHSAYSSVATSSQASLMEEIAALRQPPSTSEHSCPSCNVGVEVKKRLDDLCDQIDWLKSDNVQLKQSEERLVYLLQNTERLECDNQQQNKTIAELTKSLEISRLAEENLKQQYAEVKEKVQELQNVERNYCDYVKQFAGVRKNLQDVKFEKEKLAKETAVSHDIINRLKDEVKTLESAKKRLELTIQTLKAEKEALIEQHKLKWDEHEANLRQSQDYINELEVKFYASSDQLTSLLAQNDEFATTNAKLKRHNQKLTESNQEIKFELDEYVRIINRTSSRDLTTLEKLNLLKTLDEYNILQEKYDSLLKSKTKECEEYANRIRELENKNKSTPNKFVPSKETQTVKKTPHDRAQIQLERFREKIDHLEEVLRQEKIKQGVFKNEIDELKRSNECLSNKTHGSDVLQKCYKHLVCETKDLLSNCQRARHNMLKFYNNWKTLFEKVDSVEKLFCHLCDDDVMDLLCDQMNAITSEMSPRKHVSLKEVALSKDYVQTISLILDTLGSCNVNALFDDFSSRTSADDSRSFQSLPLSLKTREAVLSRPMSPDSPNLGAFDDISSLTIGAGDVHLLRYKNTEFVDSEGCDCDGEAGEEADRSSSEDEFDGATAGPFEVLRTMYLPENLEFLIAGIRDAPTATATVKEEVAAAGRGSECSGGGDGVVSEEEASALAGFVDDFGLTFMVDCSGYRTRLRAQFERLQEAVTQLIAQFQSLLSLACTPKMQMRAAVQVINTLFELTKLAERYGAMQQEVEASRTITKLIAYITHLRADAGTKPARNLSSATTMLVESADAPRSVADMQCDAAMGSAQHRIMSLLNTMRPTNVVRLLKPIALAAMAAACSEMPFAGQPGWICLPLVLGVCMRTDHRPSEYRYCLVRPTADKRVLFTG